jgi:hypothetical protein
MVGGVVAHADNSEPMAYAAAVGELYSFAESQHRQLMLSPSGAWALRC